MYLSIFRGEFFKKPDSLKKNLVPDKAGYLRSDHSHDSEPAFARAKIHFSHSGMQANFLTMQVF